MTMFLEEGVGVAICNFIAWAYPTDQDQCKAFGERLDNWHLVMEYFQKTILLKEYMKIFQL